VALDAAAAPRGGDATRDARRGRHGAGQERAMNVPPEEYGLKDDPEDPSGRPARAPVRAIPVGRDERGRAAPAGPVLGYASVKAPPNRRSAAAGERYDLNFPSPLMDLYVPLALFVAGAAMAYGVAVHAERSWRAVWWVTQFIALGLAVMTLTAVVVANFARLVFGPWPAAALKLAATTVLPCATGVAVAYVWESCLTLLFAWIAPIFITLGMFARLFDFELREAALCTALFVAVALSFGLVWIRFLPW